ncbi:MAG: hypothetical protein IJA69_01725 [Clostridia bacterium]|nr:hypothetical protein [Clostridia bacterium]
MKKRVKLFATIASLCLAISLMAFGVYAAATVTYNINGTVSYSFADTLVKVTRTISTVDLDVPPLSTTDLSTLTYANEQSAGFQTYDDNNAWVDPTVPTGFVSGEWATNAMTEAISFDFNTSYAYKVTVEIETKNTTGITINYTLPTVTGKNYRVQADTANFTTSETLMIADNPAVITFYVALIDNTVEVETESISSSFVLAKV